MIAAGGATNGTWRSFSRKMTLGAASGRWISAVLSELNDALWRWWPRTSTQVHRGTGSASHRLECW